MAAEDTLANDIKTAIVAHLTLVTLPVIIATFEGITIPISATESVPAFTAEELIIKEAEIIASFEDLGDIHNKISQPIVGIIEAKLEVSLKAFADEVKLYIDELENAFATWGVTTNDGGQALKTRLDARSTTTVPSPVNGVIFSDT